MPFNKNNSFRWLLTNTHFPPRDKRNKYGVENIAVKRANHRNTFTRYDCSVIGASSRFSKQRKTAGILAFIKKMCSSFKTHSFNVVPDANSHIEE